MTHGSGKQEEVLQLQQLVLHLQSELNKYKTKGPLPKNESEYEQDRLLIAHEELLYKSKKQQKRNDLYEKQVKNLSLQRDKALSACNHYKEMHETLNKANNQLTETLHLLKEALVSEIRNALNEVKLEKDEWFEQLPSLITQHSPSKPTLEKELPNHNQTEIQRVNRSQKELITILEEYVQKLSIHLDTR